VSYENEIQFKTQVRNETKRMINVVEAFYHSLSFFPLFLYGCENLFCNLVGRAEIKVLKRSVENNIWNSV